MSQPTVTGPPDQINHRPPRPRHRYGEELPSPGTTCSMSEKGGLCNGPNLASNEVTDYVEGDPFDRAASLGQRLSLIADQEDLPRHDGFDDAGHHQLAALHPVMGGFRRQDRIAAAADDQFLDLAERVHLDDHLEACPGGPPIALDGMAQPVVLRRQNEIEGPD